MFIILASSILLAHSGDDVTDVNGISVSTDGDVECKAWLEKSLCTFPENTRIHIVVNRLTTPVCLTTVSGEVQRPDGSKVQLMFPENNLVPPGNERIACFSNYNQDGVYVVRVTVRNNPGKTIEGTLFDGLILRENAPVSKQLAPPFFCSLSLRFCLQGMTSEGAPPPERIERLTLIRDEKAIPSIQWIAPGGNDDQGSAKRYEVRYSEAPIITETEWSEAMIYPQALEPKTAGTLESLPICGLPSGKLLFFAVRSVNATGKASKISGLTNIQF